MACIIFIVNKIRSKQKFLIQMWIKKHHYAFVNNDETYVKQLYHMWKIYMSWKIYQFYRTILPDVKKKFPEKYSNFANMETYIAKKKFWKFLFHRFKHFQYHKRWKLKRKYSAYYKLWIWHGRFDICAEAFRAVKRKGLSEI